MNLIRTFVCVLIVIILVLKLFIMQNRRNQTIYILECEILDFYPYFVFVCLEDFGGWRRTELAQAKTNVCVTRGGNLQGYAAAAACV